MEKIDFEKILDNNLPKYVCDITDNDVILCIKESLKQAIPIILKEAAENAKVSQIKQNGNLVINTYSITSLESEIIKQLEL